MTPAPASDADVPVSQADRGWRLLVASAGLASAGTLLVVALVLGDAEAGAYGVGFAVAVGLLRLRRGRVGEVALALLNLNLLGWMALGAVSNIREGQGLAAIFAPALLAALALAGLLSAIGALATRERLAMSARPPLLVAGAAVAAFTSLLAAGAVAGDDDPPAMPGQLAVAADNVRFAPTALVASAGRITVSVTNGDLFWHTFTIDALDLDLPVAVGAERRLAFEAQPGTYTYYCRIPGHEALMQGTLTVTDAARDAETS